VSKQALLNLLHEGNATELESIKLDLLGPVLAYKGCVQDISPTSIRYWTPEAPSGNTIQHTSAALDRLARPIIEQRTSLKAGLRLCDPPGTNVKKEHRVRQKEVEEKIEKPQIPALLAGNLSLSDYWDSLVPYQSVYKPINRQLWANWEKNRFTPYFGDSRKRNIICSACPPRWRGHVLLFRDSRLCGHAIGLDSLAMASRVLSPASTWRRHPRRHEQPRLSPSRARPPLALGGPGLAPVGRWPGPGPQGTPAGSGGARDRGVRGQTSGVSPFSAG